MSKKQRSGYRHDSSLAEKSLPLSVILPLADRIDKLELFLESLLKIRKPFSKEYEIILFARDSSDIKALITDKFGSNSLLEQGVFKIFQAGETTSENLSTGIQGSRKENLLIIDHENLERSFNFDELFNIAPGLPAKEKLVFPLFREQRDPIEQKKTHPVLLLKKNLATYLFNELPVSSGNFEVEMMYRLSKLGIKGMTHNISQVNPFGEKQVSSAVWKSLKMKSNFFLDWFIRIPLSEISSSPPLSK